MLPDRSRPKIAKTFEEVAHAIVKFEMPLPNGSMITGAGFLIDSRGWVATNHHVASMASTAARVKLNSGRKIEIEGIIALAPERDLAIVKLKELPSDSLLLDIGYRDLPKVGTRVYAYGHPLNNEFSLVEGIVSRVLTTAEFAAQQPDSSNVLSKLNAPADQLWIQTDATVSQGNSGGPLLDENCRVIGVNTFANLDARFGFASHVKYLKALADRSSGEVTPLEQPSELKPPQRPNSSPMPDKPREIVVSKEKLQQLFDAAAAFGWQPANQEDYAVMADLALMMTACKDPNNNDIPFELSDLVDQLFARMKQVPWSDEHVGAINRHAKEKITPGHGAVFVGTVMGTATDDSGKISGIIIHVSGVSDLLLVPIDQNSLAPSQDSRLLVFGVVLPQTGMANLPNQPKPRPIRFIQSHHTVSM
ncbi:MAG: serine protease [Planctomycetes bacterium]|nr:serine protease [Planctomycetota bacterium]MBU4398502.1 serine protease [Planctomycetota bacterium]MCG2684381.1 serine protease [Planctomycetales bacterium]